MQEGALTGLTGIGLIFVVCAAFGALLFVVRFVAQLLGVHDGGDAEIDVGNADVVHAAADVSFKPLSLQGLTAFFVMFGLVGLALSRGSGVHEAIAFAGGRRGRAGGNVAHRQDLHHHHASAVERHHRQQPGHRRRGVRVSDDSRDVAINQARVDVSQQEKLGAIGQAEANREKEIKVAQNVAESDKGKKQDEADRRVFVQQQEASAVTGENLAKADIAAVEADYAVKQAEALRRGEVAKREAQVQIRKAQYLAEQERLTAEEVVRKEIDKRKIEISAEAERIRREARGSADAVLLKYEAKAKGIRQVLDSKAAGYLELVKSCAGDARAAATFLLVEKLEQLVTLQVEAIKNIKIDKVTVWDSGGGGKEGSSTANFRAGLIKSLPPLQEVAKMSGLELPKYLGEMDAGEKEKKRGA